MEPKQTTKRGTPTSSKWDKAWVTEVERVEDELDHRICGAHSPAHTPCKLTSTHANGRCRYHGGHDSIGAPLGNRNAVIHGLYSRRLQQCGSHCPLWKSCPMPNKELEALPLEERPHCPYEQNEYDSIMAALREDAIETPSADGSPSSHTSAEALLHHNIATFQVMLTRAQAALGLEQYIEEGVGRRFGTQPNKVSSLLQATLRIASELRQWLKLLATKAVRQATERIKSPAGNEEITAFSTDQTPGTREAQPRREEGKNANRHNQSDKGHEPPREKNPTQTKPTTRADGAKPICCGPLPIWPTPEPLPALHRGVELPM